MIVYRIERDDGTGPYVGNERGPHRSGWHCPTRNPNPRFDGLGHVWFTDNNIFGFKDARQLVKWFPRVDRRHMAEQGLKLALYRIDGRRIKKGGKQIVFDRRLATLIERRPLCRRKCLTPPAPTSTRTSGQPSEAKPASRGWLSGVNLSRGKSLYDTAEMAALISRFATTKVFATFPALLTRGADGSGFYRDT